tara:strand:+ start:364 stop:510 length:147 start_codon:yes stop_codon:yes gene_type:complete
MKKEKDMKSTWLDMMKKVCFLDHTETIALPSQIFTTKEQQEKSALVYN